MEDEQPEITVAEAYALVTRVTAAQSLLLANLLRLLIGSGALSEADLRQCLDSMGQAASQRRTGEAPALLGLIQLLHMHLGWTERTGPAA